MSDSLDAMYVSLGKLVTAKAKLHTLKNFIHTMEMLDQSWLSEGQPVNQYAQSFPSHGMIGHRASGDSTLQEVATQFAINMRGREMINVPRMEYEGALVRATAAMEECKRKEQRIKELEELLASDDIVVASNVLNNTCV